ncbi:MAG: hypothetical protein K0Q46_5962, partial [Rhodococcus erythropolis]|nr:hypothetical protein [Rhodococcus erythropolis]
PRAESASDRYSPDVRSDCTYHPIPTPTRIVVDRDAAASLRPTESVDRCG